MSYVTSGQPLTSDSRRKLAEEDYRNFHKDLIADLGISRGEFQIKTPFYYRGRLVVGIYESEYRRENGFYFELVDSNYQPISQQRTVYFIPFNPFFDQEYEMNSRQSCLVPVEELREVNPRSVAISGPSAMTAANKYSGLSSVDPSGRVFTTNPNGSAAVASTPVKNTPSAPPWESVAEKNEDAPYSEMTIRDYVAIHTGKPVSLKSWLNELIKSKQ